jgi:hypothetical protein
VPNDHWLREFGTGDVRLPIDLSATVLLQDCTRGCRPVPAELATFLRAADGGTVGSGVFDLTVEDGRITRLVERYFP